MTSVFPTRRPRRRTITRLGLIILMLMATSTAATAADEGASILGGLLGVMIKGAVIAEAQKSGSR